MATILSLGVPALATAAPATAQPVERSGNEVVTAVCAACHGTGKDGAPKIGDKQAWSKRAAQGLSSLTQHALQGIRKMPAHGGSPGLSDLEIARAITYMVNQSGGRWTEPLDKASPPAERSSEQIVRSSCAQCHEAGANGAPKIGDRDAWIPRLKQGVDPLVRSAIKGHGGMPPRGGAVDLTDAELRSAIIYMFGKGGVPAAATASPPSRAVQAQRPGGQMQLAEGIEVYLGVEPAGLIAEREQRQPGEKMHGGAPKSADKFHVMVVLVDRESGKRLPKADVVARVGELGLYAEQRKLDPMDTAGAPAFGNYFTLGRSALYRVEVEIGVPGTPHTSKVRFDYKRP